MSIGRKFGILCFVLINTLNIFTAFAQEVDVIKVQFIYGSKPLKQYKKVEKKWFGGIKGGHVGIEKDHNQFLSFEGNDKFHLIDHSKKRHCRYRLTQSGDFWDVMGSPGDSVTKATIIIPVNPGQKFIIDSLAAAYLQRAPYDYSVFGMRCASATYEILAQLGIVKTFRYRWTCLRIFYPKLLRKKLLKQAAREKWTVIKKDGSERRKWERD